VAVEGGVSGGGDGGGGGHVVVMVVVFLGQACEVGVRESKPPNAILISWMDKVWTWMGGVGVA
jgi:hypothetical protein